MNALIEIFFKFKKPLRNLWLSVTYKQKNICYWWRGIKADKGRRCLNLFNKKATPKWAWQAPRQNTVKYEVSAARYDCSEKYVTLLSLRGPPHLETLLLPGCCWLVKSRVLESL